jgi:hypothetical protein
LWWLGCGATSGLAHRPVHGGRRPVSQRGMGPPIVIQLHPLINQLPPLRLGFYFLPQAILAFEDPIHPFGQRVLRAMIPLGHADRQPPLRQRVHIFMAAILAPLTAASPSAPSACASKNHPAVKSSSVSTPRAIARCWPHRPWPPKNPYSCSPIAQSKIPVLKTTKLSCFENYAAQAKFMVDRMLIICLLPSVYHHVTAGGIRAAISHERRRRPASTPAE